MPKPDGGPAFPRPQLSTTLYDSAQEGMSLRDYFAAKSARGAADHVCDVLDESNDADALEEANRHSRAAYMVADAMLKAREA